MRILQRLHTLITGSAQSKTTKTETWTPSPLRRKTLLCFALVYAMTAIALGILALFSHRHQGLCNAHSRDHYLWTYAPTALFTLLATLWTHSEYRAKQMQPWRDMAQGRPSDASQNVLLDYVSPWNIIVLFRATKHRQFVVMAAVLVSLLLKLLIVLSTSLFVLSEINTNKHWPSLSLKDNFVYSDVNFGVDDRPAVTMISAMKAKLPLPAGTTMNTAFQLFSRPEDIGENVISTHTGIDTLSSSLDCEVAKLNNGWQTYNATNPSGKTHVVKQRVIFSVSSATCQNYIFPYPLVLRGLERLNIYCPESGSQDASKRLFMKVGSPVWEGSDNATAMICRPLYSLVTLPVQASRGSEYTLGQRGSSPSRKLTGFDPSQIVDYLEVSLQTSKMFMSKDDGPSWADPFFILMNITNPKPSFTDYLDINVFNSTAQITWSAFTAQVFSFYFRQPLNSTVSGSITAKEHRLVFRSVSFWPVEVALMLVFALSIFICIFSSGGLTPRDPTSIMGLATILANSQEMMQSLRKTGSAPNGHFQELFANSSFQTNRDLRHEVKTWSPPFAILPASNMAVEHQSALDQNSCASSVVTWYRPFSLSLPYQIGNIIGIIGLIVALELLLRRSQINQGLTDVHGPDSYEHFAWTTFPALVMVGTAILIGLPHATMKIVSPYVTLSGNSSNSRASMTKQPFSISSYWTMWRDSQISLITSGFCVFISAFLTVAISGLYSSVAVQELKPFMSHQQDWFANKTNESSEVPLQVSMVMIGNSSFPKYTYDDLAISKPTNVSLDTSGTLILQTPSIRGYLDCELFPQAQIINSTIGNFSSYVTSNSIRISVANQTCAVRLGDGLTDIYVGNYSNADPGPVSHIEIQLPNSGFYGDLIPTHHFFSHTELLRCPAILGCFGRVHDGAVENTLFTCTPRAEKVMANVTFRLPDMEIDVTNPPTIIEGTASPLNISFSPGSGMPLNLLGRLDTGTLVQNTIKQNKYSSMDYFMKMLVYGSRGIPGSELSGDSNVDRLFSAVSRQYGLAFAQLMDNFRIPATTPIVLNGTIATSNSFRLTQSSISTRILEALLGAILFLTIVTTIATRTRKVLPKNPCSIAAAASLLAESKLLQMLPKGSEKLSDEALMAIFEGYDFSMGFWRWPDWKSGQRRFGIDIVPAKSQ